MTTLTEHIIVAGAKNHPPMLENLMYDSWASRIHLFIKWKKRGRMMLDSIDKGPLVYPTIEENGKTRPKKYSKLTEAKQLQDDCDVQTTNIILYGLPPDVYALVDHQEASKDIWDRVKMLMKGTELSYQERECILYNLFDKFAHVPGNKGIATNSKGIVAIGPPRVVKCYNCQEEGHMVRQCTQPKRLRNVAWFKEKLMLAEALEAGQILDEEQLVFLADPDCDDLSLAKAVLMANISSYDPEVLPETLILEEESRSKMLDEQNDPILVEKKIKISLIDYSKLNKIKEDFGKCFVTQKELFAEQAFWLKHSSLSETPVTSHIPFRIEAPNELSNKCLEIEIELFKNKDFVEKEAYDKLVKSYSNLEKNFISLELETQLNQEIFQRENSGENLNAPTFNQSFEINELKAQSQDKDMVFRKLKERIKSLSRKDSVENVKKDIDEIETINIELEHRKNIINTVVSKPNATLAPRMLKLDIEPISARLKNNRDAHEVYIEKTIKYADTLYGFVERARTKDHVRYLPEYFISIWLEYGVLVFPRYGVLDLASFVVFSEV
nr:hypothetical protein [Tanacetum cinerariifolium]